MANYYGYNSNLQMLNNLERQKENINRLIAQYSQPQAPVQNIINTSASNVDMEARILKDGEDASNIIINHRTLFVDEKNKKVMIKEIDGTYSKVYDIIVPLDEKDKKIIDLENKLREMEVKFNEFTKSSNDSSSIKSQEPSTNNSSIDRSERNKSKQSSKSS